MIQYQGWLPTPKVQYKRIERMLNQYGETLEFSHYRKNLAKDLPKLCTNYKSVTKFFGKAFEDDPQAIGDCTSHATRNAADISRAVEIDIKGDNEAWVTRGATEAIYRYRGHRYHGMNPGIATEFCIKYGLLLRQNYDFGDLSKYNHVWATEPVVTQEIKDECSKHPCRYFVHIKTLDDALLAMANGYGIHCGSQYGNDGRRNSIGVSRWNRNWNHDMSWGGYHIDHRGDIFILVLNSWGNWNSGGHPEWGPIPNGSFLIPESDAKRMIAAGECWGLGDVKGWRRKDLPDYGFGSYL